MPWPNQDGHYWPLRGQWKRNQKQVRTNACRRGSIVWECTGLMRLNTQADTHCRSASRLHTPPRPCQLCVLWICHTLKGWWRNTKPKHQFTVRITRTARTWGRAVASWNSWGERKKWIRIKIRCPWILKLEMFWLLPGLGAQGIDPGNLAFLEHGSCSVSCIAERLPFHTTMKNHEFQHFSRNRPRLPDRLWSHSIGQRGHVAAVRLGLSQRLLDHTVSVQLFQQSEVVHTGVFKWPPISSPQKNSLLQKIKYYMKCKKSLMKLL